jgi:hypothetical protein
MARFGYAPRQRRMTAYKFTVKKKSSPYFKTRKGFQNLRKAPVIVNTVKNQGKFPQTVPLSVGKHPCFPGGFSVFGDPLRDPFGEPFRFITGNKGEGSDSGSIPYHGNIGVGA